MASLVKTLLSGGVVGLACITAVSAKLCSRAAIEVHARPPIPLAPSQDSFYTAPVDLKASPPGAALRLRPAPGNITTLFSNASEAYNILYRTTDAAGGASWAVTTLLVPATFFNGSGRERLLSYQVAYDSVAVDGSPSYTMYEPESALSSLLDISGGLDLGWFVNSPDYEGPLAAFGAGIRSGYATLDSIRAVLQVAKEYPEIGLSPEATSTLWGYSGGSIPSVFAAELQEDYAPELTIEGAAIGGPIVNLRTAMSVLSGQPFAGDVVLVLVGITAEFPAERDLIVSKLKTEGEYNATAFFSVANQSFYETVAQFANHDIANYFVNGEEDLNHPELVSLIEAQGTMGRHGVPRKPVFVYKPIEDQFSPTEETDALVTQYCKAGVSVVYERNSVGEHLSEFHNGHTRALEWLSSIFDGTHGQIYGDDGCRIRNVSVIDTSPTTVDSL